VQTYLWAQYQQVGLMPNLYALMTILIVATLVLLGVLAVLGARETAT
jgi:putative spermidine/putrescine transport system permease protein/spermidine/putrescine transport system permease protein